MNAFLKKIIWLIIIAPAIYLIIIWNSLPEKIAVHFDIKGNPNRYGNKNELLVGVVILMAVAILIYVFIPLVYKIDPKKNAAANKVSLQQLAFVIAIFISFVNCIIINSSQKGGFPFNIRLVFGAMGLMWCIIGNYMHNLKPNYFAGIRLPWTLNSEDNWRKTHLLAGKLWFVGGLLLAITCLFISGNAVMITFLSVTFIIILIPCIYSYQLYKKEKLSKENNQ